MQPWKAEFLRGIQKEKTYFVVVSAAKNYLSVIASGAQQSII
jgi:hypothetical protein